MLKPVQRLPQYKLLLEDYLRRINHDSVDFDDTTIALRIVSDAADHANNTIRQGVRMDIFMLWQPCYASLAMPALLWQPCTPHCLGHLVLVQSLPTIYTSHQSLVQMY